MKITYRNKVLYQGKFARISWNSGWNNSICEYYSSISIIKFENGQITFDRCEAPVNDSCAPSDLIVEPDAQQAADLTKYYEDKAAAEEHERIDLHKDVVVFKGRKVKIGTKGQVFGIYDNYYGKSVGLRLLDGTKVFVAIGNVKVA